MAHSPRKRRAGSRKREAPPVPEEAAAVEGIGRVFAGHGFEADARELRAFARYYILLVRNHPWLNATRLVGLEDAALKHFIDSALAADRLPLEGPLLDVGSGAGLPGVPIAIRRPDLRVILAESRRKRAGFLADVVRELGLDNAAARAGSVRADAPLEVPVRTAITRAVEAVPRTLARLAPHLPPGGRAVFMKGPGCDPEVREAVARHAADYVLRDDRAYTLPATDQRRRLVVFERLPPADRRTPPA